MPGLDEPLVSPIVIGREEQLLLLGRVLAEAAAGQGRTLLLAGEAGIGKSRMVASARQLAQERGWRVLQGNFFEQDSALPFGGLTDLLRKLASEESPEGLRAALGVAPEVLGLLPDLAPDSAEAGPAIDPEQQKRRLIQGLGRVLSGFAERQPALVVLEDLHWADDASLEFVLHVARLIAGQQLVLLLTYRSDEVHPPLAHLLTALDRGRLASELRLSGLSLPEVDRMLRILLKRPRSLRPEVVHTVYGLTDGNPFFVEEVVRSLVDAEESADFWDQTRIVAARIPRSVQESVQRRWSDLDGEARQVLEVAAVAGRRFDFDLLLGLCGLDEEGLLAAIKHLVAADLVLEESPDQFSFRHALTRQAIYAGLLHRERIQLHRRIAEAIETAARDNLEERCEDLAYHAAEAEDWPSALTFARQAAERALRLYSHRPAVEHFSRALYAAERLGADRRFDLRLGRGKAYEVLGRFDAARGDFETALEEARSNGDNRGAWAATLALGMLWAGRDYDQAGQSFEAAAALAEQTGDQAAIAHSLNRVGNWLVNIERPGEGMVHHERALAIFRELGDEPGTASTLDLLGMACLMAADLPRSDAYYQQAVRLFESLGDQEGLASSLATMSIFGGVVHCDASHPATSLAEAQRNGLRGLEVAREIGWASGEAYAQFNQAVCFAPMGQFGRAMSCAQQSIEIAADIEHRQWLAVAHIAEGMVHFQVFDFEAAGEHLRLARDLALETNSRLWISETAACLASLYVAMGKTGEADSLLRPMINPDMAGTLGGRQVLAAWAELSLATGDTQGTLDRLALLGDDDQESRLIPRLARTRALALSARGDLGAALALLARAVAVCEEQGRLELLWKLHADLAAIHTKAGDTEGARAATAAALRLIDDLAATLEDESMRSRFREEATARVPGARRARLAAQAPGGLSPREREVAVLVARGLSNRAIADSLVLSERTAETHVMNALSKLGFSSRTQLAAWAIEHGLTSPD